jgi:hypothetical protein
MIALMGFSICHETLGTGAALHWLTGKWTARRIDGKKSLKNMCGDKKLCHLMPTRFPANLGHARTRVDGVGDRRRSR